MNNDMDINKSLLFSLMKYFGTNCWMLVCTLALACCAASMHAQSDSMGYLISHRVLSVEDGMASREVYCGLQDDDGFLWFGTRNGLNRYDGKSFQLYTKQRTGFKDNNIIQLAKDTNNHLIIAYSQRGFRKRINNIDVMELTTHKLSTLKAIFPTLPFNPERIIWVENDGDDVCFLVSKPYQYWRLSRKGFELKCEMKQWDTEAGKGKYSNEIQANWYYQFQGGEAVLANENSDYSYLISPEKVEVINNSKYRIAGMVAPHQLIWFTFEGNEKDPRVDYFMRNANGEFVKQPSLIAPDTNKMNLYTVHSSSNYDIGVLSPNKELYLYKQHSVYRIMNADEFKGYGNFFNLFNDRQGNTWICTPAGLIEVKLEKNRFTHYFTKSQTGVTDNNQARGIYADNKNKVYANVWHKFETSDGLLLTRPEINFSMTRFNNKLYTSDKYILEYHEATKTLEPASFYESSRGSVGISTLDSLSSTELLIGYTHSIQKINVVTRQFTDLRGKTPSFPTPKFVYRFIKRKDKKIWAVAENGLFLLDARGDYILDYWGQESKQKSHQFPFDRLHDALETDDEVFWLATNGDGLYRWDKKKNRFRQFNITAGFPSDILYRIEEDATHDLWISSDFGLVRFNTKNFNISTYTTKEGISHNEFNKISSYKSSNGRMYFGGLDGVNAFYPKDFAEDTGTTNIPLRIISFSQFSGDEEELIDQTSKLLATNKIVLQPGDRFFNLEFKLLDYSDAKSSYFYKIDGIDKDWNFINHNSIRLSGIPYGNYTLRVKGQSQTGRASKNELVIPIVVITPLFKKVGFQLILFVLLVLLFMLIFRVRTANLKRDSDLLSATVEKRTQQLRGTLSEKDLLLKEIHHRVKNNLQVIVSLLSMHQQKIDSPLLKQTFAEAKTNVRSISLIHENLYQHDNLAGVDMTSFADDLFKLINDLFNPTKEKVKFANYISNIVLDIETAVPLGLILNELLTNSFKYALEANRQMEINLSISEDEENHTFFLMYQDNGKGLPPEVDFYKSKTMGLSVIRDLCRQIGGKVDYQHEDNNSCFSIQFLSLEGRKEID